MKRFQSLSASCRPATSILARRIAFPLRVLSAGQLLAQPCAGAPFQFEPTGSLVFNRAYHTATLLPNGTVLVAGSYKEAEFYDPATGLWTQTGQTVHWHTS